MSKKINSRQKGARVEREFRDILIEYGFNARRGQQFAGGGDSPDVICEALPIHWEVKGVKAVSSVNLLDAVNQAIKDCPEGKWRTVVHKKDGAGARASKWMATLPLEDFMDIICELHELKKL